MNLLSLFSGIGAYEKALENLNINYNLIGFSEINPHAVKSYCSIHQVDESLNLGDITSIDISNINSKVDLLTYSFPCQDISLAGKRIGLINKDGSKTRSGLFFEALKIIEEKQPKIAIAENVKGLVTKRFKTQFDIVLKSLEEAGYNNYWKVLNSKDYGIPQNRERVFIISIRKDIDNGLFQFPEPIQLNKRLIDMLEGSVDDSYYLPDEKVTSMIRFSNLSCGPYELKQIGYINTYNGDANRVYNTNLARTLKAEAGGGGAKTGWYMTEPTICASRGRNAENPSGETVGHPVKQRLEFRGDGCSNTLTSVQKDNYLFEPPMKIRKLTPKECWRLMGFSDSDFEKAEAVNSNTQLYKQAGNSVVVNVLYYIFNNLRKVVPEVFEDMEENYE